MGGGGNSPRPPASPRSQYSSIRSQGQGDGQGTRITFRQEKGSEEGFMAVFEQFRTTWGYVSSSSCPLVYFPHSFSSSFPFRLQCQMLRLNLG